MDLKTDSRFKRNREPICPYCLHEQEMADVRVEDGEHFDWDCDNCEKLFTVDVDIEVKYSTMTVEVDD